MKPRPRKRVLSSGFDKIFIPINSSGLARSHRMVRIEKEKEILFMKLCSQIRFDDFKQKRSDRQKEERKLKRLHNYCETIAE